MNCLLLEFCCFGREGKKKGKKKDIDGVKKEDGRGKGGESRIKIVLDGKESYN